MTGTLFSDTSIITILRCLGDNASTAIKFRRTTPIVDILARDLGLDRVNAKMVLIGIGDPRGQRLHQPVNYAIQAALVRKRAKGEPETKKDKELVGGNHHFSSMFTTAFISSDYFYPAYPEQTDSYPKAVKAAYRLMKKIFEMVKNVDCVYIEKMPLDAEFVKKFSAYKKHIKNTTKLIIQNETECTLSGSEFGNFLNMMSLNSIHLSTMFPADAEGITDAHLINLKSITLGTERGFQFMDAYGITDATLEYWKTNIPQKVHIGLVRTSFSLDEIWNIVKLIVLTAKDSRNYRFGIIRRTRENELALVQAQKTRKFKFQKEESVHNQHPEFHNIDPRLDNMRRQHNFRTYTFTYTGHANKSLTFTICM